MAEQATAQITNAIVTAPPAKGPVLQRKCECGNHTIGGAECDSCRKEKASGGGNILQRAAAFSGPVDEVPPIVHEVLSSPGQPLDASTRSFFEQRFARDFSHVRIHTDEKAAESARVVHALAYTAGQNIVFRDGMPNIGSGSKLLAHELTHVVQHEARAPWAVAHQISRADDASERQADSFAQLVSLGLSVSKFSPVGPSAVLSLAPETWYRGEAEGVSITPGSKWEGGHDLGDGLYLTDKEDVAEEYASTRVREHKLPATARRVRSTQIDLDKVGKVLDLTKDERWERFLNKPAVPDAAPGYPTNGELIKTQRNYGQLFQKFCREERINLDSYKVIIGPESVRGGKQMCIRDPGLQAAVRVSLNAPKVPGGGGGRGPGSTGGGEPEGSGRRPPVKGGGPAAGASHDLGHEEKPTPGQRPSRRTTAPGGGEGHIPSARQMAGTMVLNIGAGIAVGIFQSWFKEKVQRDLDALPKPKIDKRGAADFLRDPGVKDSMSLLDLFSKHFKPLGQELESNQQVINSTLILEIIAIALMAEKTTADLEIKLQRLDALQEELGNYEDLLRTIQNNLEAVLEKEERALQTKQAADELRALVQNGYVIEWLFRMGFGVEEILQMESNLLHLSVSIDIAFRDARALKLIVDKLLEETTRLSSRVNKLWWSEFARQLQLHLKDRQKQREQAEAARRRAAKASAAGTASSGEPQFRNADEMGMYYDLRSRESELLQQLDELEKKIASLPAGSSSDQLHDQRDDLMLQLKDIRERLKRYQVQSR